MTRVLIASVVSLAIGFVVGTRWVASDVEDAHAVAAAAKLLREDKVLSLLESKELEAATRVQTEFMRLTLIEVHAQHRSWSPEVQAVLQRRQSLQEGIIGDVPRYAKVEHTPPMPRTRGACHVSCLRWCGLIAQSSPAASPVAYGLRPE